MSLMYDYLSKNIEERKQMFYNYLKSTGRAESSCKQYAFTHPFHDEVIHIIQENASKSSLFDVIDGWMVQKIHKLVFQLDGNKRQGNAWSATISNYKNFLDYLEVGVIDSMGSADPDTPYKTLPHGKLIKESKKVVEFFAFVVRTLLEFDKNFGRAKDKFKENLSSVGFNGCPFGKKTESLGSITDPRRAADCDTSITWIFKGIEYCFYKEQTYESLKVFADKINPIYFDKYRIEIDEEK